MDYNMFKELKERLSMLSRDIEDIKKKHKTSRDENYNVWGEKYTRWDKWQSSHYRQKA